MRRLVALVVAVVVLAFAGVAIAADSKIDLKADHIGYSKCRDVVVAEGHAVLKRNNVKIEAWRIEFYVKKSVAYAYAGEEKPIVFYWGKRRLSGRKAYYDFNKRYGVVEDASGKDYYTHFKGKKIIVEPRKELKYKSIFLLGMKIHKPKEGEMQERVKEAHFTTCEDYTHPQYEIVSKEILILPGDLMIIKHPSFYLKGKLLFTYPFDYIIPLGKGGKKTQFVPTFGYESDVGWYVLSEGTFFVGDTIGALWVRYGTKSGLDSRLSFERYFRNRIHMFIYGEYSRAITDESSDSRKFRYGIYLSKNEKRYSWTIRYTRDENYETVDEEGNEKKYVIARTPQITFYYKPFTIGNSKWSASFLFDWGDFTDESNNESSKRTKVAVGISRKPVYLSKNLYIPLHFGFEKRWYSEGDEDFEVYESRVGLVWKINEHFSFSSYYLDRNTRGKCLLSFESVDPAREITSRLSYSNAGYFSLSFSAKYDLKAEDWSNYYPSISWKWGKDEYPWNISIRGDYDAVTSSWNKIYYSIYKDLPCKWRAVLYFKDDRTSENDDEMWLYFYLKPFPQARFGIYKGKDNYGIITGSRVTKLGGGEW